MMRTLQFISVLALGLTMTIAASAQAQNAQTQGALPARPGSINYVEGNAAIDNQALGPNSPGHVELGMGQILTTETGKVELLLTPGVFLRVADYSSVKMISPDLANTEVAVEKGVASFEVLNIGKNNNIRIDMDNASTKLVNKGLYEFDAGQHQVRVFNGKADVFAGNRKITVKGQHDLDLVATGKLKSQSFDTRKFEDDFFRWCALRSGYLSEASVDEARNYIGTGPGWYGPNWYGPGWYWDPDYFGYTFLPDNGIFYSPFGWGFYSPIFVYRSPFFYGGLYGHQVPHHFGDLHYPYGHGFEPRGGFHAGGFHGGGFHGGFHGGGRH